MLKVALGKAPNRPKVECVPYGDHNIADLWNMNYLFHNNIY